MDLTLKNKTKNENCHCRRPSYVDTRYTLSYAGMDEQTLLLSANYKDSFLHQGKASSDPTVV